MRRPGPTQSLLILLRELYAGRSPRARRFYVALLAFDLATVAFIVATSFIEPRPWFRPVNIVLGLAILADMAARVASSRRPGREVLSLTTLADAVAVVTFLAPVAGGAGGFLRVLRTLRLIRTLRTMDWTVDLGRRLHVDVDTAVAIANLGIFVFVMTGLVYETQYRTNPDIANYADALYFTVTALSTTGFGDITLPGTGGRLLTVAIMIFGVTLFLRLAQVLFRPYKVRFPCPSCGLTRHEPDAVHCKSCGQVLNIPDEGAA